MASKLETLKAQRDSALSDIIHLSDLLAENSEKSLREFRFLFPELKNCFQEFKDRQVEIVATLRSKKQSEANDNEISFVENLSREIRGIVINLRLEFDTLYPVSVKEVRLEESPQSISPSSSIHVSGRTDKPSLPKIPLPTFDGSKESFLSFFELFNKLVVERLDISDIERFQYLKLSLKGEAFDLIKHLPVTSGNFVVAWDLIQREYYKPRILRSIHIQKLLNLPKLSSESFSGLKHMLHVARENISALEALDIHLDGEVGSGFILESILVTKLDFQTRKLWERSLASDVIPSYKDLLEFLSQHVSSLEASGEGKPQKAVHFRPNNTSGSHFKPKPKVTSLLSANASCPICKDPHDTNSCPVFLSKDPRERYTIVKQNILCIRCLKSGHDSRKCPSKSVCHECSKPHNTLLHFVDANASHTSTSAANTSTLSLHSSCNNSTTTVLLATAIVQILDNMGDYHKVRCLFDCGSQSSYITADCAKRLKLVIKRCNTTILSLGSQPINLAKGLVHTAIKPTCKADPIFNLGAIVVDSITERVPSQIVSLKRYHCIQQLNLADPDFDKPGNIDLLLSADVFAKSLLMNKITEVNGPTAIETQFGWLIMGEVHCDSTRSNTHVFRLSTSSDNIDSLISKFWELESVPSFISQLSKEDIRVEQFYTDTVSRDCIGRYTVALPFKEFPPNLGNSYQIAKSCLQSLLRRLDKDPTLRKQYDDILFDYHAQGHMKRIDSSYPKDNNNYYIPHLAVLKPDSTTTSVRVVFNASKSTSNGVSLNDTISAGPPLQRDIFELLFRIRFYNILLSTDIKQMFRQIRVTSEHLPYQRILHQFAGDTMPQAFELHTVTFGVDSSPYLAIRTIEQLAKDEEQTFPLAAEILRKDVYVDDVLTGTDDFLTASEIVQQLVGIFSSAGFQLHKWASNCPEVLQSIPLDEQRFDNISFDNDSYIKLLGIKWSPSNDEFHFDISVDVNAQCSKRRVLSEVARWYDPLGYCSPLTMKLKCLVQKLWLSKTDWDDVPNDGIVSEWRQFLSELNDLPVISIPRIVIANKVFMLIGFSDASEKGYSACIYIRSESVDKTIVRLLCAKTKVAPLKKVSLARLELCGCHLLSQLFSKILPYLPHAPVDTLVLTDSTVALYWLNSSPHRWKTFVANRVAQIQEVLPANNWAHVSSADNIADISSRGIFPSEFHQSSSWFNGPKWLSYPHDTWPIKHMKEISQFSLDSNNFEQTKSFLLQKNKESSEPNELFRKYSSFPLLQRIVARCLRFINNARKNEVVNSNNSPWISADYLNLALIKLVRLAQIDKFQSEFDRLRNRTPCSKEYQSLSPFIDEKDCIRVGGRLSYSQLPYDRKHPLLLPSKHPLTDMLIEHYHVKYCHIGPQTLLSFLQQRFWIVSAKRVIRSRLSKCIGCFRHNPVGGNPPMADLPHNRVVPSKPFSKSGVDYGGPYTISISRRRGQVTQKAYICLFVCFSTKAVHLELASDLSTPTFLAALHRFISRRGRVTDVYSDCGTNFVGASRHLNELQKFLCSSKYNDMAYQDLCKEGINWHFNPPSAPHFGGLWEAGIKSTKKLLHRALGKQLLTYEEFNTLLTEIEAILNSRPLYPMSSDPSDLNVLTPGHFLVTEPIVGLPTADYLDTPFNRLTHWEAVQKLLQSFWKLWKDNYLNTLQQRKKWFFDNSSLKEGILVLINDHPTPPTDWRLGRITELVYGKDSIPRVAKIRTQCGEITRPVVKLAPLPIAESITNK